MQEKILNGLFHQIEGANDWMHESAGNNYDCSIAELVEDCGDVYEVVVKILLSNGFVVTLHNRCKESYIKRSYVGDNLFIDDNIIYAEYDDEEDTHHQARINPESIVMIDQFVEYINWNELNE